MSILPVNLGDSGLWGPMLLEAIGPVFNAREGFGANATGTIDATAAIQAAMNAGFNSQTNSATVALPPGTYLLNQAGVPLVPAPGSAGAWTSGAGLTIVLQGAGAHATKLLAGQNFSGNAMIGYGDHGVLPLLAQIIVKDLTLDGNYAGAGGTIPQPSSAAGALVSLAAPDQANGSLSRAKRYHIFERVRFYRPSGYGFQPPNGVKLVNCEFDTMGQPAASSIHYDNIGGGDYSDAIVEFCNWHDSTGNYADFVGTNFCRLLMSGCVSINHTLGGIYAAGINSSIQHNVLNNVSTGSGVGYDGSTASGSRASNSVTNNILTNMTVNASGLSAVNYGDMVANNLSQDTFSGATGSGVPANSFGANGDFYFRQDTPGTANQRLYIKSAGVWVGIV